MFHLTSHSPITPRNLETADILGAAVSRRLAAKHRAVADSFSETVTTAADMVLDFIIHSGERDPGRLAVAVYSELDDELAQMVAEDKAADADAATRFAA